MTAIPLADSRALRPSARATFAVRAALAALAVGAAVAFLFLSRSPETKTIAGLPHDTSTVLVLDLSASISSDTYSRIGGTLAALSRSRSSIGLVVFSDAAYEALPPGSPAADLRPLVRYFTLPDTTQAGFAPTFPPNPWATTFSAGTRISAGMELAHTIALGQARHPAIILVSDLDDDPNDVTSLASVMAAYDRDRIPVRIVGLNPSTDDVALFQRLLGPSVPVAQAPTLGEANARNVTAFPLALVVLTLVVALALALRAAWSPQLEWSVR
jgi:hypothetical protein